MNVAPPTEQGPTGRGEPEGKRRRLPRGLARRPRERPPGGRWRFTRSRRIARRLRPLVHPALLSLLVCLALSVALFWPMWQDPSRRLLGGGGGDGALFMWFLRWTPAALGHSLNPLFSDYLNFPGGLNAMWNTSLLLPGLLLAPVTVTLGPVVSFTALGTLGPALSGWCATLAFRRYVRSGLAALIGGLVYGFSPYMLAQSRGHLHLTLAFLPPLLFLAVDNILVRQRRPAWLSGAVLGVMAACQLLIGEEVFALVAIMLAAQVLIMALLFPRQVLRKATYATAAFGTAAIAFAAVAGYPIWFQLFGPQHVTGAIQSSGRYVTDLWNFITPTGVQGLVPASATRITSQFTGNEAEINGYMSIPLLLIVGFTVVRWAWSNAVVRVAFLLGLLAAVLSLGDHLHVRGRVTDLTLPWKALQGLPLLESAVPSRLMLVAMLFAGLLLAVFVDQALRLRWGERVPAFLLAIAVMVALAPRLPLHAAPLEAAPFFTGAAVQRVPQGSVVLVAPYPGAANPLPMTWQALAGMRYRMPGGYFVGPGPDGRPRFSQPPNQLADLLIHLRAGWEPPKLDPYQRLTYAYNLVQWRVRTVVVGPMRDDLPRRNTIATLTELLGRPPSREAGVDVWWDVRPQQLMDDAARSLR